MAAFVNIGFGNLVNSEKVVSVVCPDAAPVKRLVQKAKEAGRVIDATQGRRTKAVLITEEDHVILCYSSSSPFHCISFVPADMRRPKVSG